MISILFKGSLLVGAQQPGVEQKDTITRSLGEVVLTAQRHQQQNVLVPYSVSTINRNELDELGSRSTPEALMGMNGVFVQKTNHGGGSPFVRGVTGNQTLILVDGIRLNNSTFRYGPNQYLNTIDAYTVKKIEVAKGTGSVQYGTDAIGGVVHILTREPQFVAGKPVWNGRLAARYMTGGMEKTVRGEAIYAGNKFALITGIGKKDFGDIIGGDTTGRQTPSGYEEWSVDIKARFLLRQNIELTVANQFLQQQHVPVYHKVVLENFAINEMDPQQRLLSYARMNIKGRSALVKETELTLSYQHNLEGRNSRKNGSNSLRKERDKINTIGVTADIFQHLIKYGPLIPVWRCIMTRLGVQEKILIHKQERVLQKEDYILMIPVTVIIRCIHYIISITLSGSLMQVYGITCLIFTSPIQRSVQSAYHLQHW